MKTPDTKKKPLKIPKRDPEFMRKIGSKGGNATKVNHGIKHLTKIGGRGGQVTKKRWKDTKEGKV